jgi:pyruvate,water dikinase
MIEVTSTSTLWLTPLSQALDPALVGGKAINLARLIGAGFRVPDGFVITTAAFRAASGAGEMPAELAAQIIAHYRAMGSPSVAVRSSATAEDMANASMAGQYETILDVRDPDSLIQAVQRCWSSLRTARTAAYLRQQQIDADAVAMAVVVQRLVPADVAGVLFTANPHTGDRKQMLIEASWGLGEMLVSGEVQPDTLVLCRESGAVLEARIGEKKHWLAPGGKVEPVSEENRHRACLSSQEVLDLWQLGQSVAQVYGRPQDLEWAISKGQLFLLQSRAITTLESANPAALREKTLSELRELRTAGRGPWVLHNLAETLPHPTPLTWSVLAPFHSGTGGFGNLYRMVGFEPGPKVTGESFLRRIAGRPYMDLSLMPEFFAEDFPFAYDPGALRGDPNAGQAPPTIPTGTVKQRMAAGRMLAGVNAKIEAHAQGFDAEFEQQVLPQFRQWVAAQKSTDLAALSAGELAALWEERRAKVLDEVAPLTLLPSFIAGHLLQQFTQFLTEHFWNDDASLLALQLSAGGPPDHTVRADHDLFELANGRMSLEEWLSHHGYRGTGEFDLAAPRWRQRPQDLLKLAHSLKDGIDPLQRHAQQSAAAAAEVQRRRGELPASARAVFDQHIAMLHRYLHYREDGKDALMLGYELLRDLALEVGRRCGIGEDIFLLGGDDFRHTLLTGFAPLQVISAAKTLRRVEAKVTLPALLDDSDLSPQGQQEAIAEPAEGASAWRGFSISPGKGKGPVAVLESPEQGSELPAGFILVCRSTDPSWTPLFMRAAGVVLECGGALSHGAVVAREMGIPAVVLPGATQTLKDGETVSVDGDRGFIARGDLIDAAPPAASQADDLHIAPSLLPPPVSAKERRAGTIRNVTAVFWSLFLLGYFLLPENWLSTPTLQFLEWALWPLVLATGKPAAVAIIAAVLAAACMLLQRLLTDHHRLVEGKRRSKLLTKEAMSLPEKSPRRVALLAAAKPGQSRPMAAAFVPLAVLLGPLVIIFMWLQGAIDPMLTVARPGETVRVMATVQGDFVKPLTLEPGEGLSLIDAASATQTIPPVREALLELRSKWRPSDLASQPWEVRTAARAAGQQMLADLDAFLAGEMKPQQVAWSMVAGDKDRLAEAVVVADGVRIPVSIAIGESTPPQTTIFVGDAASIQEVKVMYPLRPETQQIFWQPLKFMGWEWDAGWLGVYILAYVPAMFAAKFGLRIP